MANISSLIPTVDTERKRLQPQLLPYSGLRALLGAPQEIAPAAPMNPQEPSNEPVMQPTEEAKKAREEALRQMYGSTR